MLIPYRLAYAAAKTASPALMLRRLAGAKNYS